MVKIYVVRHCEAAGNTAQVFQGSTDSDISELGKTQLEFLKERFKNIHIDKAFSSPLKRAYLTAVAAVESKGIEVKKDPRFSEIDGGIIEGMPFGEIFKNHGALEHCWENHPENFAPQGGESMRQVYDRIWQGIEAIAKDPDNDGKTILVASHGAAIRTLLCRVVLGAIERLNEMKWSDNTAVSLLIFDENGVRAEFINDSSHVPEEFMPRSSQIDAAIEKGVNEVLKNDNNVG